MLKITNYHVAKSLEEAFKLVDTGRANKILGGAMWLRQSNSQIKTAIDISKLGLNYIKDDGEYIKIGAMTTLSDLANSELLETSFKTLFSDMVYHIVGTQFRNTATIGGSVFGRYGFSDIITGLLPLQTVVKTVKRGEVPLEKFVEMDYERDLLEYVKVKKDIGKVSYKSFRNQATDFPVLTVCVSQKDGQAKISVGARPKTARLVFSEEQAMQLDFGSNMRGSAEYRRQLCKELCSQAMTEVL